MEHDIDFKDGIITYENLFWLFNNTNELKIKPTASKCIKIPPNKK